jgi:hypothetical protein
VARLTPGLATILVFCGVSFVMTYIGRGVMAALSGERTAAATR